MAQESARPVNPVAEDFSGESLPRIAKRAFHATRPKFFYFFDGNSRTFRGGDEESDRPWSG